jgi:predicted Rossmann fold flavoprotein
MTKDVLILGAGAAGLMCAVEAGKRGRSVLVLEHQEKIGKKILISGGGRCNFTNRHCTYDNFLSGNPHFCKSALKRFTPDQFIALMQKHHVAYHEKTLGQLFCNHSARDITAMLQKECDEAGVEIRVGHGVLKVEKENRFILRTDRGDFESDSLVIATGGLSIPKIGATDLGYTVARQFGIRITELRPALVPLTFDETFLNIFGGLSGVSVDAIVRCGSASFRENILFTHRGLSGPAILQISSFWKAGDELSINLLPEGNAKEVLLASRHSKMELSTLLSRYLSKRFVQKFCEAYCPSKPMNQYSVKELEQLSGKFHRWSILPSGTEGFEKAEVTVGGIDTSELSSKTMEVAKIPGLYFIGEVVDVTGHLGGHNFQWAWASGFAAGQYV